MKQEFTCFLLCLHVLDDLLELFVNVCQFKLLIK